MKIKISNKIKYNWKKMEKLDCLILRGDNSDNGNSTLYFHIKPCDGYSVSSL